jgi:transcriptional regulator of acetoin/glycerol metabolism
VPLTSKQHAERDRITQALQRNKGRRGAAAEALGMDRSTLFRKMNRYGMASATSK